MDESKSSTVSYVASILLAPEQYLLLAFSWKKPDY